MEDNLIIIKSFSSEMDARIASTYIESQGIQAFVKKDDCGGNYPQLQVSSGIQLHVRLEDEQKVRTILTEMDYEKTPKQEPSDVKKRTAIWFILYFLLGTAVGFGLTKIIDDVKKSSQNDIEIDNNGDNKPDAFYYYKGEDLLRVEVDRNYDGQIDVWYIYSNNKITSAESDDNFDGNIDGWSQYIDENNFTSRIDTDFNGKTDATIYVEHQLKIRTDWQPNESSLIIKRELFEHGNKKQEYIDSNQDGKFDIRLDFDSLGNEIQRMKLPVKMSNNEIWQTRNKRVLVFGFT